MKKKKEILSKQRSNGIKRCVTRSKTWRVFNLKWKYNQVMFNNTWTTNHFIIEYIEAVDEGAEAFLLIYKSRQIEYFKTLAKAKMVAQLIHEA